MRKKRVDVPMGRDHGRAGRVTECAVMEFVQAHITSVWSLELLVLLARDRKRMWSAAELIREMRSSSLCVAKAVKDLTNAGLIREAPTGRYRLALSRPGLEPNVASIQNAYACKPTAIVRAIARAPRRKGRQPDGQVFPDVTPTGKSRG